LWLNKGQRAKKIVEQWISEGKKVKYSAFVSNEEIITDLILKRYDAALFDYLNALYISRNYGLSVYKDLIYRDDLGYIILNKQIEQEINEAIRDLKNEIPVIISKYVGKVS